MILTNINPAWGKMRCIIYIFVKIFRIESNYSKEKFYDCAIETGMSLKSISLTSINL